MRLVYVANQYLPSNYVDSIQVIKTVEALALAGARVSLVVPAVLTWPPLTRARLERRIAEFYGLDDLPFDLLPVPTLPRTAWEFEKELPGLFAPLFTSRRSDTVFYTRYWLPFYTACWFHPRVVFETHRDVAKLHPLSFRYLRWASQRRNLLAVVTNADLVTGLLREGGVCAEKVVTVHNGHDGSLFAEPLDSAEARRRTGLPLGRHLVFYGGTIGAHKAPEVLLALARQCKDLLFCIAGEATPAFREAALSCGNVLLTGWLGPEALRDHLAAADVLLIPPSSRPLLEARRTLLPLKLYQYLAAGRPIVAPDLPDIREVLDGDNALLVAPDRLEDGVMALRRLLAGPDLSAKLAKAALQTAKRYTWVSRGQRLLAILEARLRRGN